MVDSASDDVRHQYRVLTDDEKHAMMQIKDAGLFVIKLIDTCVPPGREASIAKTKIEEAVMWAVKGLTG